MWYKTKQNITHIHVFSIIVYIHTFPDIYLSKLSPRATQLTLVSYFGSDSYKLLDYKIDSMYSKRNVSFEKRTANLTKSSQ